MALAPVRAEVVARVQLDQLPDADWERMRAAIKAQNEKDKAKRTA